MTQIPSELTGLAEKIVAAMMEESTRFTVNVKAPRIELRDVVFTKVIDPGNQLPGYEGVWRKSNNERCGRINFNSDDSFFAEYDLFCPHPTDEKWYVEMVTAWGRKDTLRVEVQLIPS